MFQGAATAYAKELPSQGVVTAGNSASSLVHCTFPSAVTSWTPGAEKHAADWDAEDQNFREIGFGPIDPLYFAYGWVAAGGCGNVPNDPTLYNFYARGRLGRQRCGVDLSDCRGIESAQRVAACRRNQRDQLDRVRVAAVGFGRRPLPANDADQVRDGRPTWTRTRNNPVMSRGL
jgi:hypothetical protein